MWHPLVRSVVHWGLILAVFSWPSRGFAEEKVPPLVFDYPGFRGGLIVIADRPGHIGINSQLWKLDKTQTTRYAAEFLQRYIAEVTGATLPIVPASQAVASPNRPWILVGKSDLTDFVEDDRKKLPPEGFIIRRRGSQAAIVGETAPEDDLEEYRGADRGTLFGVYEFLERVYGVRWYFPGELGVVVAKRQNVPVTHLDFTDAPYYAMRLEGLRPAATPDRFSDLDPCIRPGNSTGFWTNHTSNDWYRYAKDHPEVFAADANGKQELTHEYPTSNRQNHLNYLNPTTLEIEVQRVKEFCEQGVRHCGHPSLWPSERYVRFFPRDNENVYHDESPGSQALWTPDRENSMLSEIIFGYVARFASALVKEYPGRRLAFGAYAGYLYPPTTLQMPDNADVLICTVKGNSLLVSAAYWNHNTDLVTQWWEHLGKDRRRVFLWEYFCYPVHHLQLYPHVMQRWLQFCKGKVMGAFNNGFPNRQPSLMRYRLSILNGWLWHKLLWNPDADVDALLSQFCRELFGPAAPAMSKVFNMSIEQYETAARHLPLNPGASSYIHPKALYRGIYPPEFTGRLEAALDEAVKAAPPDSVFARRVAFFREAFDEMLKEARDFYRADQPPPRSSAPRVDPAPKIDGNLDDAAWAVKNPLTLVGWRLGEPAEVATEMRVVHDSRNLYVAAKMALTDASKLAANGACRDDAAIAADDYFAIDLDAVSHGPTDLPSIYRIMVNASGQISDGVKLVPLVMGSIHRSGWYGDWSPSGLQAAARKLDDGWSVELAVPWECLSGFSPATGKELRVQFIRQVRSSPLGLMVWSPMLVETYEYDLARMGTLVLE